MYILFLDPSELNNSRYSNLDRPIIQNHKYIFLIPKQKPYELTNMEMKMVPCFTMFSENCAYILTQFCIDVYLENRENL